MLCGTDKYPEKYRAKKYKIHQKFLSREEFRFIMRNLPVSVSEQEIEEMFAIADTDRDDKISYEVNQTEMSLSATWISQPELQKKGRVIL